MANKTTPGEATVLRLVRGELARANQSIRAPISVAEQTRNQTSIATLLAIVFYFGAQQWPAIAEWPPHITAGVATILGGLLTVAGNLWRNLAGAIGLARWLG